MDYTVHGILQARILEVGSRSLLQGIFLTQRIEPRSPALQADSLPAEPPGKGKIALLLQLLHRLNGGVDNNYSQSGGTNEKMRGNVYTHTVGASKLLSSFHHADSCRHKRGSMLSPGSEF